MNSQYSSPLFCISPVDGRYSEKTTPLKAYFSEAALIKYRLRVEVRYFLALCDVLPELQGKCPSPLREKLREIPERPLEEIALRVKEIEAVTNHDVKAIEYYLKEIFAEMGLNDVKEFIHFGLTSQDINNTAFPLMLKEAVEEAYLPVLEEVVAKIEDFAIQWKNIPMLARTHGQPASPTRLGKEFGVYAYRLREQLKLLTQVPHSGKFGGATGNFNAHKVAYPTIDWHSFAEHFLSSLGLVREEFTTQISNYDNLAALFQGIARIHTILVDFARDIWMYISLGYFRQRINAKEVGSSAMPHKVNPIDFENAEGNLLLANSIALFLAQKLPISRLQRDLTDSTVIRNQGLPIAYGLIAFRSLLKGMGKLLLNEENIRRDLENNFEVVAEAIQTILRREGFPNPYEELKAFTRTGKPINAMTMAEFVEGLNVDDRVKEELLQITPSNYLGL